MGCSQNWGVADVTVAADWRRDPIRLYPSHLRVAAEVTTSAVRRAQSRWRRFRRRPGNGAAQRPGRAIAWIKAQQGEGCEDRLHLQRLADAGGGTLLDGRRATGHSALHRGAPSQAPDDGVGARPALCRRSRCGHVDRHTASISLMMALVEAIGGRTGARRRLAVASGCGRTGMRATTTSAFQLTSEHRKTFVRNKLTVLAARDPLASGPTPRSTRSRLD